MLICDFKAVAHTGPRNLSKIAYPLPFVRLGYNLASAELVQRLLPVARESGDERFLQSLCTVEKCENGAERQRRLFRDSGNWQLLIKQMSEIFSQDLLSYRPLSLGEALQKAS